MFQPRPGRRPNTPPSSPLLQDRRAATISAAGTGEGAIILSWSAALDGWVLQSTLGLNPPKWQDDPNNVTVVNGQNTVKEPMSDGMFYRLRSPNY